MWCRCNPTCLLAYYQPTYQGKLALAVRAQQSAVARAEAQARARPNPTPNPPLPLPLTLTLFNQALQLHPAYRAEAIAPSVDYAAAMRMPL